MFWIYGGGFSEGSSSVAVYDGAQLARKGVIVHMPSEEAAPMPIYRGVGYAAQTVGRPPRRLPSVPASADRLPKVLTFRRYFSSYR